MLFENYQIEIIKSIITSLASGYLILFTLKQCNQRWAQTYQLSVTFLLLPVITYVITSVIQNNIALSLGMVGALSIVRFRHPVKSPLELVLYFALITIGISAGVNLKFTILLTLTTIFVISIYYFYYYKLSKNKQPFSSAYFEGQDGIIIEVESKKDISNFLSEQNIIELFADIESNEFSYKLFFQNTKEARKFYNDNLQNNLIKKIKYIDE